MLKITFLTALALVAFAGNSVLCRLALGDNVIDAASFTSIRLLSGIIFLFLIVVIKSGKKIDIKSGSWLPPVYLYVYAITFSYSYITLDAGTGALILFGAVQVTMIVSALLQGRKLALIEWAGLLLACLGLSTLLLPGSSAPSLTGFVLMAVSGVAWGGYTLAGRGSTKPLIDNANNFLRTLPLIALTMLLSIDDMQISNQGAVLAIVSGALTSGLGYAIWYSVLPALTVTVASVIQLTVPVIAAFGGVLFLNEVITLKLLIASMLVLGGILVVTVGKQCSDKLIKQKL